MQNAFQVPDRSLFSDDKKQIIIEKNPSRYGKRAQIQLIAVVHATWGRTVNACSWRFCARFKNAFKFHCANSSPFKIIRKAFVFCSLSADWKIAISELENRKTSWKEFSLATLSIAQFCCSSNAVWRQSKEIFQFLSDRQIIDLPMKNPRAIHSDCDVQEWHFLQGVEEFFPRFQF